MSETDDRGRPMPDEAPEADIAEQRADLEADDEQEEPPAPLPFDADEADVTEQHREVRLDEDDYR
ncbi:hypothetical protein [Actinomadura macra]|uniref:hypothetical protein n=1 Tax=Actinomadura macra TaxID=46164 RepID=UPI00082C718C|nr:hypothetical protein [Actinomadura macra]